MALDEHLKKIKPLSIKTYAAGFIILLGLAFGGLGWLLLEKMNALTAEIQRQNLLRAGAELSEATARSRREAERLAQSIADWDETRQQLSDPAYYGYWRDNRALNAGRFPDYLMAVELYDPVGKALADNPVKRMPKKLGGSGDSFLAKENGKDYLYLAVPVLGDETLEDVSGFVALKLDFIRLMQTLQNFRYADAASITIASAEGERIPAGQIVARLKYAVAPNPEVASLLALMQRSQYQIALVMISLSLLLYLVQSSLLAEPLRRLSRHIDSLREGKSGLLERAGHGMFPPVAELEKMRESLNDYQSRLTEMHANLDQKNDELWILAHHDPLTGGYNRRCFEEDWNMVLSVADGHRIDVSFLLFDCDHFKAINDTYGHQTGDQVIQAIASSLQGALRHGDRLYRLGGDEFATLLLDLNPASAAEVAERCIEAVSSYDFQALGIKEPVRISIGLAHAPGTDMETLTTLQKQADVAMYHAKRPAQNKIAIYTESMAEDADALFSNSVVNAVFEAITSGSQIEMHYQPVLSLASMAPEYYEALVRIRQGNELIMPAAIFPVVERRRLEAEFDFAVLEHVLQDCLSGKIPHGTGVAINLSGLTIIHPEITEKLAVFIPCMENYKIVLEITETALITQLQQASRNLKELRKAGFVIALDDFGSGYSSLGYLAHMPVDMIKFDISLVNSLAQGTRQSGIVESLAGMVNKAGYQLVAEGMETEEALHKITELGFSHGQGYLLGRPDRMLH